MVNFLFPNVKFYRRDRDKLHWLPQAIVGGIFLAVTLFVLNWLFTYIGQILGGFVSQTP